MARNSLIDHPVLNLMRSGAVQGANPHAGMGDFGDASPGALAVETDFDVCFDREAERPVHARGPEFSLKPLVEFLCVDQGEQAHVDEK